MAPEFTASPIAENPLDQFQESLELFELPKEALDGTELTRISARTPAASRVTDAL